MRLRSFSLRSAALASSALLAAGCGAQPGSSAVDRASEVDVWGYLEQRAGAATWITYAEQIQDYLPNQLVRTADGEERPGSYGIVVGEVAEAEVVAAGVVVTTRDGATVERRLAPDDPGADWRLAVAVIDVRRAWTTDSSTRVEVLVPVPPSGDSEAYLEQLRGLDDTIAVISHPDPNFDGAYRMALTDTTLGVVSDDGSISFPALSERESAVLLADATSLLELERLSRETPPVIDVGADGVVTR